MNLKHTVEDRFLRYVKINTTADPFSASSPSSEVQKNLTKVLVDELNEMGIEQIHTNDYGYVYATIPSNSEKEIEGVFFCSHIDTAPDVTGENVKPIVHRNYQGQDIVLPDDKNQVITPLQYPKLLNKLGHDIITASGLTLLGSDDKSGVAIIMDALFQIINNPSIEHGPITALFTTDEEIGRGVQHVEIDRIPATFGYTLDGGDIGDYADSNFSADSLELQIEGVSAHPGYAKGKMHHAIKIAAAIIDRLPKNYLSPESTSGMEGFIHPVHIEGGLESAMIKFILRDFEVARLDDQEALIRQITEQVIDDHSGASYKIIRKRQYRNMHEVVKEKPYITSLALEAMKMSNITPVPKGIRGGTDGAELSSKGLPCPNIFAGMHAIHSRHEWTSVQDMEKAVETVLNIVRLNAERF